MPRFTRRRFLEDSLIAASVTMAAARFPAEAQAQEKAPAPVSPNERIQVAVIGMNRGGAHVSGYMGQPDAVVAAVCDVDLSRAERTAAEVEKKTGQRPKVYQDLRKLYEDKDIDAVSMALPIHWHALASIWAMQAGKDVYVEKPVSHNVSEGRRLVEAAEKYRKICQSGTQSRSHKATRDSMAYVHSGKVGKVLLSRGLCYKPRGSIGIKPDGEVPQGVDYDLWLGPAPKRAFNPNRFHYNWHWHWDYGSGDLGNQGIHQMDIARWALRQDKLPNAVVGLGGRFGYEDQGETPNTAIAFFDYGNPDLIFEVRGLKTDPLLGASIGNIIYGTDGYVVVSNNYGRADAFDNDGNLVQEFRGGGDHFRNFLDAVKSRKPEDLNAPAEEGHLSSALCHLGNVSYRLGETEQFDDERAFNSRTRNMADNKEAAATFERFRNHLAENGVDLDKTSYRLGRHLNIDPRKETFKRDKEANEYLTRDYRGRFVVPEKP